jgi:hypothetical protein
MVLQCIGVPKLECFWSGRAGVRVAVLSSQKDKKCDNFDELVLARNNGNIDFFEIGKYM